MFYHFLLQYVRKTLWKAAKSIEFVTNMTILVKIPQSIPDIWYLLLIYWFQFLILILFIITESQRKFRTFYRWLLNKKTFSKIKIKQVNCKINMYIYWISNERHFFSIKARCNQMVNQKDLFKGFSQFFPLTIFKKNSHFLWYQ